MNNAYVAGEEEYKGKIQEGFLADLVVLDQNPLTVPGRTLKDIRVMITMVDGVIVFERPRT